MILNDWLIKETSYIFFHEYSNLKVFLLQLIVTASVSIEDFSNGGHTPEFDRVNLVYGLLRSIHI